MSIFVLPSAHDFDELGIHDIYQNGGLAYANNFEEADGLDEDDSEDTRRKRIRSNIDSLREL